MKTIHFPKDFSEVSICGIKDGFRTLDPEEITCEDCKIQRLSDEQIAQGEEYYSKVRDE